MFKVRKQTVVKGSSAALIVTVAVHVILLLTAGTFVAMKVIERAETKFEGKQIVRPKMKIKKLQVPIKVKKIQQPKLRQTVTAKAPVAPMQFKMPAMGGVKGGMGSMTGIGGLGSLGFGMRFDTLFGGDAAAGNELVGTFYDLKQSASGEPVDMTDSSYCFTIKNFTDSWNERKLRSYYQAPNKKYALALIMPVVRADTAPEAFGVADKVRPMHWAVHYKGEITAPETGRYRFCGQADDALVVRVNRKVVLDASHPKWKLRISDWESRAPETGRFRIGNTTITYGDWISLRKGQKVPIEILLGEIPGGWFSCYLLIEQEGKAYRQVATRGGGLRPVLPVFKMAEIPEGLKQKMKIDPNVCTLEGPVFGAGQ